MNISSTDKYNLIQKELTKKKNGSSRPRPRKIRTKGDGHVFSISGAHGVGKTTVCNILINSCTELGNIKFFPERLREKPPVPFGSKDKKIAFRSEIHFNQQMIKRNLLVKNFIGNHREHCAILDRSPLSVLVYTRALGLPKVDLELIEDTFNSVDWVKETIIYLEASTDTILSRIHKRGSLEKERLDWNEDDFYYLKSIQKIYKEVFGEKRCNLIRISTEDKDPFDIAKDILDIIKIKSGISMDPDRKYSSTQSNLFNYF